MALHERREGEKWLDACGAEQGRCVEHDATQLRRGAEAGRGLDHVAKSGQAFRVETSAPSRDDDAEIERDPDEQAEREGAERTEPLAKRHPPSTDRQERDTKRDP